MKVVFGLIGALLVAWGLVIIFLLSGYPYVGIAVAVLGVLVGGIGVTVYAHRG